MKISKRKKEHLEICLNKEVEGKNYFNDINLVYNALPDIDFRKIDTKTNFLGKKLNLPLIISSLTGGTEEAREINKTLAKIAEKKKIGFALGSQRAMIENKKLGETYFVRDVAPSTLIFGNIGIVNLKEMKIKEIEEALDRFGADALFIHLNPAQEVTQIGGNLDFKNSAKNLKKVVERIKYPVVVKEVGLGISREVGEIVKDCGVRGIDVSGTGGTNWIKVEKLRGGKISDNLLNFGIPTPCSLLELKNLGIDLISSGGIRNGVDIAKSLTLGAKICGIALPFLKIYEKEGEMGVIKYIDELEKELKTVMFLVGAKDLEELGNTRYILSGFVKEWREQIK